MSDLIFRVGENGMDVSVFLQDRGRKKTIATICGGVVEWVEPIYLLPWSYIAEILETADEQAGILDVEKNAEM